MKRKPVITLETETQLRIFMLPLRQRILRILHVAGKPMTSKQVADKLGIAPSSARHHLRRLRDIDLVEHDHYEMVNGIRAEYLRASQVTVSIGTSTDDAFRGERNALTRSMLAGITSRFLDALMDHENSTTRDSHHFNGDLLSGIVHLTEEDARSFHRMTAQFLEEHAQSHADSEHAWEVSLLFHKARKDQT